MAATSLLQRSVAEVVKSAALAIVLCTSADAQMQQQWSAGLLVVALKLRPWGRRRQLLM